MTDAMQEALRRREHVRGAGGGVARNAASRGKDMRVACGAKGQEKVRVNALANGGGNGGAPGQKG